MFVSVFLMFVSRILLTLDNWNKDGRFPVNSFCGNIKPSFRLLSPRFGRAKASKQRFWSQIYIQESVLNSLWNTGHSTETNKQNTSTVVIRNTCTVGAVEVGVEIVTGRAVIIGKYCWKCLCLSIIAIGISLKKSSIEKSLSWLNLFCFIGSLKKAITWDMLFSRRKMRVVKISWQWKSSQSTWNSNLLLHGIYLAIKMRKIWQ